MKLIVNINLRVCYVAQVYVDTDGNVLQKAISTVNTVESGNLHSVTSNAVAGALSVLNSLLYVNLPRKLFEVSSGGSVQYYKATGLIPQYLGEVTYFMQSRAGELVIINAGHGEGDAYINPKAKRITDTYKKILSLGFLESTLYFALNAWSHETILTRICGIWLVESTELSEVSASEYSRAINIPID